MGGMLGYGYAGLHDDLEGLITIGAPADLGRGSCCSALLALASPVTAARHRRRGGGDQRPAAGWRRRCGGSGARAAASTRLPATGRACWIRRTPTSVAFNYVPVDAWLRLLERLIARAEVHPRLRRAGPPGELADQPQPGERGRHPLAAPRGRGARAAARCIEQFARWIRRGELTLLPHRLRLQAGLRQHRRPRWRSSSATSIRSPRWSRPAACTARRGANTCLWRPVKGNSHIELTMGHDIRQICYDIKNLVEYARTHRTRGPRPRLS